MPPTPPASPSEVPAAAPARDARDADFVRRVVIATSVVAAFVVGFLLLAFAPDGVILTFAAVWFGCVLYHASAGLARLTRFPFKWAFGLVVALIVAAAIGFVALLGMQIATQVKDLASGLDEARTKLAEQLEDYPQLQRLVEKPPSAEKAAQALGGTQGGGQSPVAAILMTPFGLLINMLFVFFTGVYLAASSDMYTDGLTRLFPVGRREKVRRTLSEAGAALWHWTLARLFSMVLVGTAAGIGLALLGVPMAATLGVATALFQFVPNVGPVLGAVLPLLLSFGQGGWTPLYVLLLYIGIELVESYLITPIIHEKEDALPAAITIVAQLVFGILFGLLGVTFAMPIALVTIIFVQRFYVERTLEGHKGVAPAEP